MALSVASAAVLAVIGGATAEEARHVRLDRASAGEIRRLGWDAAGLATAVAYAKTLSTDTLPIVSDGRTVASLGDSSRRYDVHSIRKALLSALVGQHVGKGPARIDLDATLAELGIDDTPEPLSPM